MKTSQNTPIDELDILNNPVTETMIYRYLLASSFCKNKIVADAACGCGYGSMLLKSLGATIVRGFDFDKDMVELAQRRYTSYAGENIDLHMGFEEIDLIKPLDDKFKNEFETVVSIETFEHLPPEHITQYLLNLYKMCEDKGTIFITTPKRHTEEWVYDGGTHLKEYSSTEFKYLIETYLPGKVRYLGIQEKWVKTDTFQKLDSFLVNDVNNARIMCAIIEVDKQ